MADEMDVVAQLRALLKGDAKLSRALEKKVRKLEEKLRLYEEQEANPDRWTWTIHREVEDDAYPAELPVPRLQVECIIENEFSTTFRYDLIYRHYGEDKLTAVPLGRSTRRGSGSPTEELPEPHRDAFHIRSDAEQMGLPAFKVHGKKFAKLGTLAELKKEGIR